MKVVHISNSDISGGAAIASHRIHQSLILKNIESRMWVNNRRSDDFNVIGPQTNADKVFAMMRRHIIRPALKTMQTDNKILHSPAILPSNWSKKINKSNNDIVNLHWIGAEMASIADIGKIKKPTVWTLHDMWAFCGAEHISWDERWFNGYTKKNRPSNEKGFDINRWTWERKLKHWKSQFHIVAVSNWLSECAKKSVLMRDWPVTTIPNSINTKIWKPEDKMLSRKLLGLPEKPSIIAFGTYGANSEYHKGFDLLSNSLEHLKDSNINLELAIFGQSTPQKLPELGFKCNFMGHFYDELSLRLFYSAIDVLVVPSRIEAFGQTASESMACGTPVAAFGATGLLDIVDHKKNGYLAKPYESEDLANGVKYILKHKNYDGLCDSAREKVVTKFDSSIVGGMYENLYTKVLND